MSVKTVYSLSFFRHPSSAYESERCGEARGIFFVNYFRAVVRAHWAVNADYELWVHHDDRVIDFPYFKALVEMDKRKLLKLIYCREAKTLCGAMVWRLRPIWNEDVDFVLSRDLDALPTWRERKAVETWKDIGNSPILGLHDSVSHKGAGLMGGMVSFRTGMVRPVMPRLPEDLPDHGDDQRWLNSVVRPLFPSGVVLTGNLLGGKLHPIDKLTNHVGGAFHVDPAVKWFDENPGYCPRLDEIRECEEGAKCPTV